MPREHLLWLNTASIFYFILFLFQLTDLGNDNNGDIFQDQKNKSK